MRTTQNLPVGAAALVSILMLAAPPLTAAPTGAPALSENAPVFCENTFLPTLQRHNLIWKYVYFGQTISCGHAYEFLETPGYLPCLDLPADAPPALQILSCAPLLPAGFALKKAIEEEAWLPCHTGYAAMEALRVPVRGQPATPPVYYPAYFCPRVKAR